MPEEFSSFRPTKKRTPSRAECEAIIKKILTTEAQARTVNSTFKKPSDFMGYFESLYPPSAALTKQVQRAIAALDMARDSKGYYIINKSKEQSNQDNDIRRLLTEAQYSVDPLETDSTVFLKIEGSFVDFVLHKLADSITMKPYITTMVPCYNGILIYTKDKEKVIELFNSLNL